VLHYGFEEFYIIEEACPKLQLGCESFSITAAGRIEPDELIPAAVKRVRGTLLPG
jgi:hypothetical protein